jgi:hypothetical protein
MSVTSYASQTTARSAKLLLAGLALASILVALRVNAYKPPGLNYHTLQFAALSGHPLKDLTATEGQLLTSGIKLDFVFLVLYPLTLFWACRLALRSLDRLTWRYKVGRVLSWAMLSAIPSDAFENYTMLHYISSGSGALLAAGAICTVWNFTIAGVTFFFVVGDNVWPPKVKQNNQQSSACGFPEVVKKERQTISKLRRDAGYDNKIGREDFIGLSLSGGGIRSATFSLGILQALADFNLLRHLDYLSTVSGGGYIGSWLTARLKQDHTTIDQLEGALSPVQSPDPNSAEWEPIQFLRSYSNYLSPQLGLFSADTWSIAGIWLRNTVLIQSILILGIAAILLAPRWGYVFLMELPTLGRILAWTALGFALMGSAWGLRKYGTDRTLKQWQVLLVVVSPLFLLCCYSVVVFTSIQEATTRLLPLQVGILIFFSLLIVQEGGGIRTRSVRDPLPLLKLVLFTTCSSVLAGALTYGLVQVATAVMDQWLFITAGPLVVVASLSLVLTFQIGLLGRALEDGQREWISRAGTWLNISAVCWLGFFFTTVYGPWLALISGEWFHLVFPTVTLGWVVTTAAGLFSAWSPKSGGSGKPAQSLPLKLIATYAPYAFVVGLLFLLSFTIHVILVRYTPHNPPQPLFDSFTEILKHDGLMAMQSQYWDLMNASEHFAGLLALASIGLVILAGALSCRFDLNEFSMHHFYKNRLTRCYLGAARKNRTADRFIGFDPQDDFLMCDARQRPYPLINATLNVVHGKRLAWQERKATSFVFTPEYCGFSPSAKSMQRGNLADSAYRPTTQYGGKLHLGTAMAISGAAVNPNMGSFTSPATAFLMTVFNVRLGWWLGNPRHQRTWYRSSPVIGMFYLFCELLGGTNEDRGFVNLSDGGHFENLGIYELVRRRCKYIITCDGSQDSTFAFEDLGNAIRKCRADFGAEIEIDVSLIRPDAETGRSRAHCAVGKINYPAIGMQRAADGYLVYIKTSLTGDEPADVLEYRKLHPEFPHQSTADQWFSESQFESYRRLGYDIGRKVFERSTGKLAAVPPPWQSVMDAFFEDLRDRWVPAESESR